MTNNIHVEKAEHQTHNLADLRAETSKLFQSAYEHLPSAKEVNKVLTIASEVLCPPLILVDHVPAGVMKAATKGIEEEIKQHPVKFGIDVLAGMTGALSIELGKHAAKPVWESAERTLAKQVGKEIGEAAGKHATHEAMLAELSKWHPAPAGGVWQEVQYKR